MDYRTMERETKADEGCCCKNEHAMERERTDDCLSCLTGCDVTREIKSRMKACHKVMVERRARLVSMRMIFSSKVLETLVEIVYGENRSFEV